MQIEPLQARSSAPEFLRLAGHPLRWRILEELARSDRMVHELTSRIGEAQNLVSYHLGKLRAGELVFSRRSAADRRDTYYALDLERVASGLSAAGAALHPGLRLVPPAIGAARPASAKVLFLCTGNSARSQMAERLIEERSGGAIEAYSAGSHPKPLHPNAIRVMREKFGLDLSGRTSKPISVLADQAFDCVISLCDKLREVCPEFPGHPETIHWSLPNPASADLDDDATYPAFQATAAELESRIGFLLAALGDRAAGPDAME